MIVAAFGNWGGWVALTAIGTVGAVVVALGLQLVLFWREKRRRPRLTLAFDDHQRTEEMYQPGNKPAVYLRTAVSNAEGKETARDVELLLLEVEEFSHTSVGSGGRTIWLANPALGWTHSFDAELRYQLPRQSIPPGATRYVDVGRWLQLEDGTYDLSFVLSVIPEPVSRRHVLESGCWRLRIAATMQNGNATFWDARICFAVGSQGLAQPAEVEASVAGVSSATAAAKEPPPKADASG